MNYDINTKQQFNNTMILERGNLRNVIYCNLYVAYRLNFFFSIKILSNEQLIQIYKINNLVTTPVHQNSNLVSIWFYKQTKHKKYAVLRRVALPSVVNVRVNSGLLSNQWSGARSNYSNIRGLQTLMYSNINIPALYLLFFFKSYNYVITQNYIYLLITANYLINNKNLYKPRPSSISKNIFLINIKQL